MPQEVRDLHQSGRAKSGDPDRLVRDTVEQHLLAVCTESGVKLGAHDRRILAWLSDGDTGSNQVIIGLIRRAYACGIAKVQTGAGR